MKKRFITCLMLTVMTVAMSACSPKEIMEEVLSKTEKTSEADTAVAPEETPAEDEQPTQIANPWSDCATLAEAEKIAGFSYQFGEAVDAGTFHAKTFRAMEGMIDVGYAADGDDACSLIIRQAAKTADDISGDETQYSHDFTVSDAGVEAVRCRGSKDELMVCSFDFNDSSFVIYPGDLTYNEVFYVIGEMTGVDPEVYTDKPAEEIEEEYEEEPLEGAPVVEDSRLIDEAPIDALAIAGSYSGINLGTCSINMYTSPDEEYAAVGTVTITDDDENLLYEGEIMCVMNNFYELMGDDVNFTVYSDNGNYGIDLYINGEHADYFVMFEHYES